MTRAAGVLAGLVLAGTVAALAVPEVLSQPLIAGEAHIVDGDTLDLRLIGTGPLEAKLQRIRIAGIDAPERGQRCGAVYCGLAAKHALQDAIGGDLVTCKPSGLDKYGRTLAQCATARVADLGRRMVALGYARSAVRYGDRYRDAEEAAKAERAGLWRTGEFGDPEAYRRQSR